MSCVSSVGYNLLRPDTPPYFREFFLVLQTENVVTCVRNLYGLEVVVGMITCENVERLITLHNAVTYPAKVDIRGLDVVFFDIVHVVQRIRCCR